MTVPSADEFPACAEKTVGDLKTELYHHQKDDGAVMSVQISGNMETDLKAGKACSDAAFLAFKQGNLEEAIGMFSDCLDLMY